MDTGEFFLRTNLSSRIIFPFLHHYIIQEIILKCMKSKIGLIDVLGYSNQNMYNRSISFKVLF